MFQLHLFSLAELVSATAISSNAISSNMCSSARFQYANGKKLLIPTTVCVFQLEKKNCGNGDRAILEHSKKKRINHFLLPLRRWSSVKAKHTHTVIAGIEYMSFNCCSRGTKSTKGNEVKKKTMEKRELAHKNEWQYCMNMSRTTDSDVRRTKGREATTEKIRKETQFSFSFESSVSICVCCCYMVRKSELTVCRFCFCSTEQLKRRSFGLFTLC